MEEPKNLASAECGQCANMRAAQPVAEPGSKLVISFPSFLLTLVMGYSVNHVVRYTALETSRATRSAMNTRFVKQRLRQLHRNCIIPFVALALELAQPNS